MSAGARIVVAFGLAALAAAAASAAGRTIAIREADFSEELSKEVAVSGEVRVGVVAGVRRGPSGTDPLVLHVRLPVEGPKRLCIKLTSRDGRYRAEGSGELSADQVGEHAVTLPTHYGALLREQTDAVYLAPLVTLSDDERCRGKVQTIVPAGWADAGEGDQLTILVNSGGLATRLLYSDGNERKTIACAPIKARQLVAFDTACEVELPPRASQVAIERQEFGDIVRVPLPLAGTGPPGRPR